jgi:hypothetical protein
MNSPRIGHASSRDSGQLSRVWPHGNGVGRHAGGSRHVPNIFAPRASEVARPRPQALVLGGPQPGVSIIRAAPHLLGEACLLGDACMPPSLSRGQRITGCCARANTGHAAALPSPAMNSRRRIPDPPADRGGAYRGGGCKGTGYVEACRRFGDRTKGPFAAVH